jgi:hypothetical protein
MPSRHRPPRAPQNPMARLAQQVLDEAVRAAGTADALAERMEPHVQKRYGNSAIYAYTNERAVPPGDALLAAALATGISLDEKLGFVRQQSEVERQVEELRAEMAELRGMVAGLHGGQLRPDEAGGQEPAPDVADVRAERQAQRQDWARRSVGPAPSAQTPPANRPAGRPRRP